MDTKDTLLEALRNYVISVVSEEGSRTDEDFVDRRIELAFDEFLYSSRLEQMIEARVESYMNDHLDDEIKIAVQEYMDYNIDIDDTVKVAITETLSNCHINVTSEADIEIN